MADLFKLMGTIAIDNSKANASIDETTGKAESAGKRQQSAFGKVASAAGTLATGVVAVGGTMVAAAGSMLALSTSTEDYAVQQGKLQTAFELTGKTADQANATFMELQGVLGDSDRAVETAGNIAQIAKSQQDLDKWTNICTGAFATFGDGLPVEGLAEAANETAKTGVVTGQLADALNWTSASAETWNAAMSGNQAALSAFNSALDQGMSKEDAFNEALKACTTEQERAQLVTDTLNGLYSEAGDKYSELNADLIESRQAQAEWNAVIGQAGEAVRPFSTALTEAGTSLVSSLMPYLTQFADWASQALPVIVDAFGQLGTMIGNAFQTAAPLVQQFFQSFTDSGGIIEQFMAFMQPVFDAFSQFGTAVLPLLMPLFQQLFETLTQIGTTLASILGPAIQTLLPLIMSVATQIASFVIPTVQQIFAFIQSVMIQLQPLISAAMSFILGVIQNVWPSIQNIIQSVMSIIQSVIQTVMGVIQGIITTVMGIINGDWSQVWTGIQQVASSIWSGIQGIVEGAINAVSGVISAVLSTIQSIWSGAWSAVSGVLSSAWEGIKSGVQNGISAVVGFVSGIPGSILGALGDLGSLLWNAGSSVVSGLLNGIKSAIGGVYDFVSGIAGTIASLKGPIPYDLKLLIPNGKAIMEGLAGGLDKGFDAEVRPELSDITDDIGDFGADANVSIQAQSSERAATATESLQADIQRLYRLMADYLPRILAASDKQLVLDTGALVGGTVAEFDRAMGERQTKKRRGQ